MKHVFWAPTQACLPKPSTEPLVRARSPPQGGRSSPKFRLRVRREVADGRGAKAAGRGDNGAGRARAGQRSGRVLRGIPKERTWPTGSTWEQWRWGDQAIARGVAGEDIECLLARNHGFCETRTACPRQPHVSKARDIVPGRSWLVTRRVSERRFFLRPDRKITQIFSYLLGVAAERHGTDLHQAVVMSNHYHLVLTDRFGLLPDFQKMLNQLSAKSVNVFRGRWEAMWAPGSYSAVWLTSPQTIIDKMVYCAANPTASDLVARPEAWPGLCSVPEDLLAGPVVVSRPEGFFKSDGPLPETASLRFTKPWAFDELDERQFVAEVRASLDAHLVDLKAETKRSGRRYLGPVGIMAQDWRKSPRKPAPRRQLNPEIAGREVSRRVAALLHRRAFLAAYRRALTSWCEGARDVTFPHGTWWMRVFHNAPCHPPP